MAIASEGRLGRWSAYGRSTGTLRRGRTGVYRRQNRISRLSRNLTSQHVEKKTIDTVTSGAVDSTGTFILHNQIGLGTDIYQRNGRRVVNKTLQLDYWLSPHTGVSSPTIEYIRIITFYDRQSNGTNPTIADLLTSTNSVGTAVANSSAFLNPSYYERFIVLRDDRIALPQVLGTGSFAANTLNQTVKTHFQHFGKLKDLISHYEVPGGGDEPSTGSIWTYAVGVQASPQYDVYINSRLRFADA